MPEREYRIHPAIGIARVGNAVRSDTDKDFYFIGPEFPDVPANYNPQTGTYGDFKTKDGWVKPQAAQFRIFEYEKKADGRFHPVGEVMASDTARAIRIEWTVHLANRKASFCEFHGQAGALDKPLFSSSYNNTDGFKVRNFGIKSRAEREKWLDLDPGPQSIIGGNTAVVAHFSIDRKNEKNDGTKLKITTLGELRSDGDGRLIVIGGMGQSDCDKGLGDGCSLTDYANNDGWFDDVSDGPVDASLTIDGVNHPVLGAWVLVGPPDFAPAVRNYRTMYDTLIDVIVREMDIPPDDGLFADDGPLAYIAKMNKDWKQHGTIKDYNPSFTRDIAPILRAICRMERVHEYKLTPLGRYHGSMTEDLNFDTLGGPGSLPANRKLIFDRLRNPNTFDPEPGKKKPKSKIDPTLMPSTYGDYVEGVNGRGGKDDPAYLHSVSKLQYALLEAWKDDHFEKDWRRIPVSPPAITPAELDRAALESMSGGAFFPGMEVSWLLEKTQVWAKPFRFARKKKIGTIPVPGEKSRRDLIVEAGAFSQQMALPWQADFRDCKAEFETDQSVKPDGLRRIGWWPANRPDEAFPESSPNIRRPWARFQNGSPFPNDDSGFHEMVKSWSTLGFVIETTPAGAPKDLYEVEFDKKPAGIPPGPPAPQPPGPGV